MDQNCSRNIRLSLKEKKLLISAWSFGFVLPSLFILSVQKYLLSVFLLRFLQKKNLYKKIIYRLWVLLVLFLPFMLGISSAFLLSSCEVIKGKSHAI